MNRILPQLSNEELTPYKSIVGFRGLKLLSVAPIQADAFRDTIFLVIIIQISLYIKI